MPDTLAPLAEGMFNFIVDTMTVKPRESISVEIDAQDMDELVVEWLNGQLFKYDSEGFLPREYSTIFSYRYARPASLDYYAFRITSRDPTP